MNEPLIENGFATVSAGSWLISRGQPAAVHGKFSIDGLRGFIVPDRRELALLKSEADAHLSCSARPFLSHLVSTDALSVVSSKLLVAPSSARKEGYLYKVIPLSFRDAIAVTRFSPSWIVTATTSRLKRIVLEENEVLCVKREAAVAWTGKDPTGVAGRVRLRDVIIPKKNLSLALDFYGPQVVWVEGSYGI